MKTKGRQYLALMTFMIAVLSVVVSACSHTQNAKPSHTARHTAAPAKTDTDSSVLSSGTTGTGKLENAETKPTTLSKQDVRQNMQNDLRTIALDESWELVGSEDNIVVHSRKIEGSPLVEFRGETLIQAPVAKVAQVLVDTPRKLEWVDRIHTAQDIRVFSPLERIEYNRTKAPWPVKDRDFVFHAKANVNKEERSLVIQMESIDTPDMPVQDCCVRGELRNSVYVLRSVGGGRQTQVTLQIHADPRGSVPSWIVNMIQKSWPRKTLQSLRTQAVREDVIENPYFKEIFDGLWGRNGRTALR